MWKLNIEDDQANLTTVNLVRDEYRVGRDVDNAVRLTERNISRKHAILVRDGDQWIVRDLHSYNGCFVNGKRVGGEQVLHHGDLLQLGDYRLELLDEDSVSPGDGKSTTVPVKPLSQTFRELPDRLVMIAGPAVGVPFSLMDQRIVVGRGEECDLPINDTSVSRVHAEILALGNGKYEIKDRGSSNGVRINGVELERAIVEAGDVIELGDVQLKFVPAGQIYHAQQPTAGRPHTLEPGARDASRSAGTTGKLMAVAGVVAVAAVIAAVTLGGGGGAEVEAEVPAEPPVNPAAQALAEAHALMESGDIEGALHRVQDIPADSNLRESTSFKEIHARWADAIFEEAANTSDKTRKRALLDLIAKSPDVGSIRRKRAVNEIAALDADSVDIDELPSAGQEHQPEKPEPKARPKRPVARPRPQPTVKEASNKPEPPPRTPPKQPSGGLIRETPF